MGSEITGKGDFLIVFTGNLSKLQKKDVWLIIFTADFFPACWLEFPCPMFQNL